MVDPTKIIGNIQRAMLSIMSQLSSYSIQFIQEINKLPIKPIGWAATRLGDIRGSGSDTLSAEDGVYILDLKGSCSSIFNMTNDFVTFDNLNIKSEAIFKFDPTVKLAAASQMRMKFDVYNDTPIFIARYPEYDPLISEKTPFIGYEYYLRLTPEQRANTVDIYHSPVLQVIPVYDLTDISDIIIYDTLNPMNYLSLSSNTINIQE